METTRETTNLIYPLRSSELVSRPDFLQDIEPLPFTEKQKKEVLEFEEPFFEELKRLKEISVSTHTIYPGAFVSEEGSRLFSAVYLDKNLKERLESLAAQRGVELEKSKTRRQFYDAFFDDLLRIINSDDDSQMYEEEGSNFQN